MNLLECLDNFINKEVKIGSAVGFIYCDKIPKDTKKFLMDLTYKEYDKLKTLKNKHEVHLENFDDFWKKKKEYLLKILKEEKKSKKVIALELKLLEEEKEKDLKKTKQAIETYTRKIKNFTLLETREVIEVYDSIYDIGTSIIIIKGEEQGTKWFKGDISSI